MEINVAINHGAINPPSFHHRMRHSTSSTGLTIIQHANEIEIIPKQNEPFVQVDRLHVKCAKFAHPILCGRHFKHWRGCCFIPGDWRSIIAIGILFKTLNQAERRYSTLGHGPRACYLSVKHSHHVVKGHRKIAFADHKPLK